MVRSNNSGGRTPSEYGGDVLRRQPRQVAIDSSE